jgi:hypothetical protein
MATRQGTGAHITRQGSIEAPKNRRAEKEEELYDQRPQQFEARFQNPNHERPTYQNNFLPSEDAGSSHMQQCPSSGNFGAV